MHAQAAYEEKVAARLAAAAAAGEPHAVAAVALGLGRSVALY